MEFGVLQIPNSLIPLIPTIGKSGKCFSFPKIAISSFLENIGTLVFSLLYSLYLVFASADDLNSPSMHAIYNVCVYPCILLIAEKEYAITGQLNSLLSSFTS